MTLSLLHAFNSAVADSGNAALVQPSNWNAEHTIVMATAKVLGRATAGTGTVEELATTGTGSVVLATAPAIAGGGITGLTGLAVRDTSAAFDVTLAAVSSVALTAGRALTLDMGNVAHTLAFGTTANTITFPNAASGTVPLLNLAQTFTAQQTIAPSSANTELLTLTMGTMTANTKGVNISGTWNNASVVFDAPLYMDITATAFQGTGNISRMFDFKLGGVSTLYHTVNLATVGGNGNQTLFFGIGGGPSSDPFLAGYNVSSQNGLCFGSAGITAFVASGQTANGFVIRSTLPLAWNSGNFSSLSPDLFLTRKATATLQFGAADAAAPVAQTISVQSVVAGTSNTAGVDRTENASVGTGTGAGGKFIFQTAPSGSTGTAQNALATALTLTAPAVNMQPSVVVGNQALATNATDGFLYIPTCAGTPSGTPTAFTGRVAMVFDTTNNKFYIYNGAWKGGTSPGAFT